MEIHWLKKTPSTYITKAPFKRKNKPRDEKYKFKLSSKIK
jgi:hypothetical protein